MKFFNKLKSYETQHSEASVTNIVDWIDLSMELGESPAATDTDWTQNDAVNIITIHSAKGLEFPVIFLVNLVSQRFPSVERREQIPIPDELIKEILPEGDNHLQEERRLFYVGMTRARDKLFLTAADFYGEAKREKKLSPFIFEALGSNVHTSVTTPQLSLLNWQKTTPFVSPSDPYKIDRLSYSQIQCFLDCPLHYKARYILKIPTPPTASLSFGTTIHLTLKDFYTDPSQNILDLFQKNWTSLGYLSKEHEKKFFTKGQKFLSEFLATQFDPQHKPALLEQSFVVPLSFNNKFLKISGKIDRVDVLSDGTIEIIDYKTGKESDNDLQLSFYALAASSLKEPPFNRKPEEIKLSLHYLETQNKITSTRTAEELEETKQKIFNYADQISRSDFKCSGSMFCKNCEYQILCDH